jgi:hypothetical protein
VDVPQLPCLPVTLSVNVLDSYSQAPIEIN